MTELSEARFTAARADCPSPHYWTSNDSDSTEHQVTALVAAFVAALQPEFVLETGTAFGQTALAIGRVLATYGHGRLVTLETDPQRAGLAAAWCSGLPVTVLNMSSLDYTPVAQIDFAWFDSLFHLRPLELRRFAPHLSERAVVGVHDTAWHHPVRALLEPLEAEGLLVSPLYLPTPRGVCFARVGRR